MHRATRHATPNGWFRANAKMLFLVGLLGMAMSSCQDEAKPATSISCRTGDKAGCTGADGCTGLAECQSDGTWSECACEGSSSVPLGQPCDDDSTCPSGASCLLPVDTRWLGGGPPEGLCVADCTGDPTACNRFANAVCVASARSSSSDAPHSLCMPKCDLTVGTAETRACAAVPFSACEPLDKVNAGYCRPFCLFDGDCATEHCDREVGVCVTAAVPTKDVSFGETCDPTGANCAGVCLKLSAAASICSNRCTFGVYTECAIAEAEPIAGVCAYAATTAKPGNLGYCTPLCNCNADCVASGFVCQRFSSKDTQTALGRMGMCIPAVDSVGGEHEGVACVD